ncbi:MAG: LamG-like jellyroll fold domain-containing protein [Verrucomicrobiota bacterium]
MNAEERNQLITALLEDDISEADFLRLEAELHIDPAARRAYYDQLELNTLLQVEAENLEVAPATPTEEKIIPFAPRTGMSLAAAGIAAALALLLTAGFLLFNSNTTPRTADRQPEPVATGFGVLSGASEAIWNNHPSLAEGDLLPAGPLQLTSGIAHFELFSGVNLVVEGDATLEIHSPMEITVTQGKVRATVPEFAHGFRIRTDKGEIVDLGTEFAIDISDANSEIHVIDGEIEWHPAAGDEMRHMKKGQALRMNGVGPATDLPATGDHFVGTEELQQRLSDKNDHRRQDWLEFTRNLSQDPRLVAYFPMTQSGRWDRKLADETKTADHKPLNGAIVAANRATDRFGTPHGAVDFSPAGSRVRLNVPNDLNALTFLCWTKIDSLDRWFNSLFLTDGHELNEPHWQIMDDGRLFFSVKKREGSKQKKDKHIVYSPSFWTTALSGKWVQLAVTYDGSSGVVTHYLNGEPFHQETLPEEFRVDTIKIGPASIGNWSQPMRDDPEFSIRNLNGSIDEFAIFNTALSADEIAQLYQNGKPF